MWRTGIRRGFGARPRRMEPAGTGRPGLLRLPQGKRNPTRCGEERSDAADEGAQLRHVPAQELLRRFHRHLAVIGDQPGVKWM